MNSAYISLDFPTVPAPLRPPPARRPLTQRLNDEAGFLQVYLRDGLNVIQPFRTLERYAGFLTVQYHMLCDQQRYCSGEEIQLVVPHPGLANPAGANRMQADLIDLDAWPAKPVPPAPTGMPLLETLGWLYASEGLMLSLAKLAQARGVGNLLGLSAVHGGRHLSAPLGARTRSWRRLAQTLDSGPLSNDQGTEVVAGACLAYHRLDELLSLALGKLN